MTWADQATPRPIVCGHRGAPAVVPENTMPSFHAAVERGATWVEFDVRPTGDSKLVIHHDPLTESGTTVAKAQYGDLDTSIPVFGDLVSELPGVGLDIEMKTDQISMSLGEYAQLVIAEVDAHCVSVMNLIVTSFNPQALLEIRNRRPNIPTGLLFWEKTADWAIDRAVDDGHQAIAPWIPLLTAELVDRARAASLDVITWTVNEADQVRQAVELNVDMIIGDDPAVIVENL